MEKSKLVITHNSVFALITNELGILERIDFNALRFLELHAPKQLEGNVKALLKDKKIKLNSKQRKRFDDLLKQLNISLESKTITDISNSNIIDPYKEVFEQVEAIGIWDDHYRYRYGLKAIPYYETNDVSIILRELTKLASREENYFIISPEIVYELVTNKNGLWDQIGLERLKGLKLFAPIQLSPIISEMLKKNKITLNSESKLRLDYLEKNIVLIDAKNTIDVNSRDSIQKLFLEVDHIIKSRGIWVNDRSKIQETTTKHFTTKEIISFFKRRKKLEKIVSLNKFEIIITNKTLAKIVYGDIKVNLESLKELRIYAPTTIVEQTMVIIERKRDKVDFKQIRQKIENIVENAILLPIENEKSILEGYQKDFRDFEDDIEVIYELLFEKIKTYGVWDNDSYRSYEKDLIPFLANNEVLGLIKEIDEIRNIVDNGITKPIEKKTLIPASCDLKGIWLTEEEWLDKKEKGMYQIQYVSNFLHYEGLLNLQDSEIYYFSGINNDSKDESMFDLVPDYASGYGIKPSEERRYLPIFNEKNVAEIEIWRFEYPEEDTHQDTVAYINKFEIPPSEIKFIWQLFLDFESLEKNKDSKSISFKDLKFKYKWHLSERIHICFAEDVKADMKSNFEDDDIKVFDEQEVRQHLNISEFLDSKFFLEKNAIIKIGEQSFVATELIVYYLMPGRGSIENLKKKEEYDFKEKLRLASLEETTKDFPKKLEEPETVTICGQKVRLDSTSLNLSNRNISKLPSTIGRLANLEKLELAYLDLIDLPDELKLLKNLKEINLSNNNLDKLPKVLCSLSQLEKIDLNNNELTHLPPEISQLSNLRILDLNNNELTHLPSEIGQLKYLKELILNDNKLEALPEEIGNLTLLEKLDLGDNKLITLPSGIGNLILLTALDINSNQLTCLPPEFGNLKNLTLIGIRFNQLTTLPPEFGNLSQLKVLYISDNKLSYLPPELGKLKNLRSLYLKNNQLSTIPSELGNLKKLEMLVLHNNKLTSIPREVCLLKLICFSLHNNKLTELPPEFFSMNNPNHLNLSDNQLVTLPPEIRNSTQSEKISLSGNNLTRLPAEIGQLTELEILYLNDNQLKNIPSQFGDLTKLGFLNLENNLLTTLPPEIGNLRNLWNLNLQNNKLVELPPELGNLSELQELNLKNNLIKEIPSEIATLLDLRSLDITNNKIKVIPKEFELAEKLIYFFFDDYLVESAPLGTPTSIKIGKYYHSTDAEKLRLFCKDKESIIRFSKTAKHFFNLRELSFDMDDFKEDIDEKDLLEIEKASTKIFSDLGMYTPLEKLSMFSPRFNLPDEFGCLVNLKYLFIRRGKFDLPSTIGKLTNLEILTLEGTDIKSLPAEIGMLSNLEKLTLRETAIRSLPAEFGKLSNLKELNIRSKYISNLPIEFGQLIKLEELAISCYSTNEYKLEIPNEFRNLENLRSLRINEGFSDSLPKSICFLKNLVKLTLRENKLVSLPSEIQNLKNLEELDCSENKLASLPSEIQNLKNLEELDCSNNKLVTLPTEIGGLTKLRRLILSKNNLCALPAGLGGLTNLVRLRLGVNNLTSFPPEIGKLENLREISCFSNQLTSLPTEFNNLINLKRASLHENQIAELPPKIGNLQKLERLYLDDNQITSLPSDLGELKKLTILGCSNNQIKSLPRDLGQLANLEKFEMSFNELTELPLEIGLVENLESMDFYNNKIQKIPSTISNLKKLKTINFGKNQLTVLPIEISQLKRLTKLEVVGNPITNISKEINPLVIYFSEKNVINSEEFLSNYYSILQLVSKPLCIQKSDDQIHYDNEENLDDILGKNRVLAFEFAKIKNFEKSLDVMTIVERIHECRNYYQHRKLKISWETYHNIAYFLKEQGFCEEALIFIDKGISLHHKVENCSEEDRNLAQFDFFRLTGDTQTKKGDLKKALETYKESLKIIKSTNEESKINDALQYIAIAHARLGEFKEALKCFHSVSRPYGNYNLLYDEGFKEKAYEYLLEEQKLHPKDPKVFFAFACNASQIKKDKSIIIDYLGKAITYGDWWTSQRIHKNSLFDDIRDLPEFHKMFTDSLKNRKKSS